MRHQKPAAAALLQGMEVVARRRLRNLVEQRMGVTEHDRPHRSALRQLGAEASRRHAEAVARHLNVDAGRRAGRSQQQGEADHALVADGADLGCLTVGHGVHERPDAGLYEIDGAKPPMRPIERLPVRQRNLAKVRSKTLIVLARQHTKQSVGMAGHRLVSARHRIFLFIERSTPSRRPSRFSVSSAWQCAGISRPILVRPPGADVEAIRVWRPKSNPYCSIRNTSCA